MLSTWGPPVLAEAAPQSSPAWEVIPRPGAFLEETALII